MAIWGILFAVVALLSWGFGDFFIQKTTRGIGVWKALFYIDLAAAIIFFPFVYNEIGPTFADGRGMIFLTAAAVMLTMAALFIFRSYKEGKLAVVDPILTIELPITVLLGIFLWQEKLDLAELLLIGVVFLGVVLTITQHNTHLHFHKRIFEKGVLWGLLGAVAMGAANFLFGASSQETSPLMAMWYTSAVSVIFCLIYMTIKGELKKLGSDLKNYSKVILGQTFFDNVAWTAYAFSMILIPISIATTISESYIAISVILGILVNREKIKRHQKIGIALAIFGVVLLGIITS